MTELSMPAMYQHCIDVYSKMRVEAIITEGEDDRILMWEGFLTRLTRGLGLSTPYYTMVRQELVRMGCIRQLRRGGGTSPSQWELVHKPTPDLYHNAKARPTREKTRLDTLEQRIKDLHERLCNVEQQLGTIISAVNRSA